MGVMTSSDFLMIILLVSRSIKDKVVALHHNAMKVTPPAEFTVVKGALESGGPVLKRTYEDEEISISVMRMLFLHAEISKRGQGYLLHFLCGLCPDALGIHKEETLRHKHETSGLLEVPSRMRDAFHGYIEKRGITNSLFPFLQIWLYVKDHRRLVVLCIGSNLSGYVLRKASKL
ncbi:uncharacterized protein [Rutidosis leptorrhynchoides]|uniref:uncharacterized protein n=1 Tax=Rutidosis leptorrhynchoides TaxID=125765 RepID=UPI003A99E124